MYLYTVTKYFHLDVLSIYQLSYESYESYELWEPLEI